MSDYLWDKSGDPDAEVERLEELLGSLRHRPRALELTAEAVEVEPQRSRRFTTARDFGASRRFDTMRRFPASWVAVAAVLLLAFLVGASVFVRTRVTNSGDLASSQRVPADVQRETASVDGAGRDEKVAVLDKKVGVLDEKVAVQNLLPKQGVRLAVVPKRRQRLAMVAAEGAGVIDGGAFVRMRAESREGASSVFENARLLAKEQLVYALRLTGAKLRGVQRKTQGFDDTKPAFDKRERIK
jgi:hypothetical protein